MMRESLVHMVKPEQNPSASNQNQQPDVLDVLEQSFHEPFTTYPIVEPVTEGRHSQDFGDDLINKLQFVVQKNLDSFFPPFHFEDTRLNLQEAFKPFAFASIGSVDQEEDPGTFRPFQF